MLELNHLKLNFQNQETLLSPRVCHLAPWVWMWVTLGSGPRQYNQKSDGRVVGSLGLTYVVSSYHSLLWVGQSLLLIWEIEDTENQAES